MNDKIYLDEVLVAIIVPGIGSIEPACVHVEAEWRPVPVVHAVEAFQ